MPYGRKPYGRWPYAGDAKLTSTASEAAAAGARFRRDPRLGADRLGIGKLGGATANHGGGGDPRLGVKRLGSWILGGSAVSAPTGTLYSGVGILQ
jgi:hypothetical protein